MDVYQPSGYGRRKRRDIGPTQNFKFASHAQHSESEGAEYSSPLSQHWSTKVGNHMKPMSSSFRHNASSPLIDVGSGAWNDMPLPMPIPPEISKKIALLNENKRRKSKPKRKHHRHPTVNENLVGDDKNASTKFGDNIGFSVIMPAGKNPTTRKSINSFIEIV